MLNQDYALALWRRDAAKDDPVPYTARYMCKGVFVWASVAGNAGWYCPEIEDGELMGLRSIALPRPSKDEMPEEKEALNRALRLVSPKQAAKIVAATQNEDNPHNR